MVESSIQTRYAVLGWLLSVTLHLGLGGFFLIITVDMTPIIPEFAELTITRLASTDVTKIAQDRLQTAPSPSRENVVQRKGSRIIDLPKRQMTETENEAIPLDLEDKVQARESARRDLTRLDPMRGMSREPQETVKRPAAQERRQPGPRRIDVGRKIAFPIPSEGVIGDIKLKKLYEISWEGGIREVLAEKLPTFPDNVAKEVVLTFRIEVLPDGTVKDIVPLKKVDVTLDSIAKQSLKQWLFNPLEKSAPQENQSGVVTFRFILQ